MSIRRAMPTRSVSPLNVLQNTLWINTEFFLGKTTLGKMILCNYWEKIESDYLQFLERDRLL